MNEKLSRFLQNQRYFDQIHYHDNEFVAPCEKIIIRSYVRSEDLQYNKILKLFKIRIFQIVYQIELVSKKNCSDLENPVRVFHFC